MALASQYKYALFFYNCICYCYYPMDAAGASYLSYQLSYNSSYPIIALPFGQFQSFNIVIFAKHLRLKIFSVLFFMNLAFITFVSWEYKEQSVTITMLAVLTNLIFFCTSNFPDLICSISLTTFVIQLASTLGVGIEKSKVRKEARYLNKIKERANRKKIVKKLRMT